MAKWPKCAERNRSCTLNEFSERRPMAHCTCEHPPSKVGVTRHGPKEDPGEESQVLTNRTGEGQIQGRNVLTNRTGEGAGIEALHTGFSLKTA